MWVLGCVPSERKKKGRDGLLPRGKKTFDVGRAFSFWGRDGECLSSRILDARRALGLSAYLLRVKVELDIYLNPYEGVAGWGKRKLLLGDVSGSVS